MKPRPSDAESIEATAAAWLAQRDDAMTRDDERSFVSWRATDPRHEAAVVRLERTWAALQPLRDFRPEAVRHPDRDLLARPARGKVIAFPARLIAVAAAIVLSAGWWVLRPSGAPAAAAVYATTVGGYERVMLADGSVLELDGDTSAEVRFTTDERRVKLARGEAHFTVAKNAARPFWVVAGGVAVRAVGTAFNVRLGATEIEVLVTEGKVSISEVERVVPNALAVSAAPKPTRSGQYVPPPDTFLIANERAVISTARPVPSTPVEPPPVRVVERIAPEAVREALAWQSSRLVFVDTPLAEVVAQFNRRNRVQLVLADAALGTLPIGGSFRAENVEGFVRLLASGGDVAVAQAAPNRIVLRKVEPGPGSK